MINQNIVQLTVLVIYDEFDSSKVWSEALEQLNLQIRRVEITENILEIWRELLPDMVIFEDFNAHSEELIICHKLRMLTPIPILLLTRKSDENLLLEAYNTGFDECIVQPLNPQLFLAKVRAWMRYSRIIPSSLVDNVKIKEFVLDIPKRSLTMPDRGNIQLTYLETSMMYILMNNPEKPIDPVTLIERVWGGYGGGDKIMLKNLVYRLRRKIEPNPDRPTYLQTDGRLGYSFSPQ